MASAVPTICGPAPFTKNVVPLAKLAFPAKPTDPTSPSDQTAGSVETVTPRTVREIAAALVKLPEVPLIVTVTVPVAAVLLAATVNVLVPTVLAGLNDAVTPLGRPDTDKLTLPLNPFCGLTVTVLVPLAPWVIARLLGVADSVKFGGAVTVRKTLVVCDKLPDTPVMVTVTVPAVAALLAVSVNVLEVLTLLGLNDTVTPLGRPDADKLTLPLKPFSELTVIMLVPAVPWTTLTLLGEADSV
jgi:hypothetical protein